MPELVRVDCCGGANVTPFPSGVSAVWPCENYTGTTEPIPDVQTPLMAWEGFADASTILAGEITWSPPENPATVTLVEIRPPRQRRHSAFPDACFNAPPDCHQKLDLTNPRNWRYHSHMLWLSYEEPETQGPFLQSFLPCPVQSQVIENDEFDVPGTCYGFTDEWNLVYISGTTNFQQKALQGAAAASGPTNFGDFSTNGQWMAAAASIVDRLVGTGFPFRNNWFFAGHSYGSAVASVIAASMKLAYPERRIVLFTEGAPCPGDIRLKNILAPLEQVHLQNEGDPVCSMPPNGLLYDLVAWALTDDLRTAWKAWHPHNRRFRLADNGTYVPVNEGTVEFNTLLTLTQIIAEAGDIPAYDAHGSGVYLDRCLLIFE